MGMAVAAAALIIYGLYADQRNRILSGILLALDCIGWFYFFSSSDQYPFVPVLAILLADGFHRDHPVPERTGDQNKESRSSWEKESEERIRLF